MIVQQDRRRAQQGSTLRVRLTILVEVALGTEAHVDIRILPLVLGLAGADLDSDGILVGAILQMMPVAYAGLEPCAVAGPKDFLTRAGDQRQLALEDIHELVLRRMPVALTRPRAGRQAQKVHPKIRESRGVA